MALSTTESIPGMVRTVGRVCGRTVFNGYEPSDWLRGQAGVQEQAAALRVGGLEQTERPTLQNCCGSGQKEGCAPGAVAFTRCSAFLTLSLHVVYEQELSTRISMILAPFQMTRFTSNFTGTLPVPVSRHHQFCALLPQCVCEHCADSEEASGGGGGVQPHHRGAVHGHQVPFRFEGTLIPRAVVCTPAQGTFLVLCNAIHGSRAYLNGTGPPTAQQHKT
eukprot:1159596-Pelagomonas_calceolata.AAC.5